MMFLSISFEGLHGILRTVYEQMMKLLDPMMSFAAAIAGLGMLFFIGYRIWQSIARAEPIDVFALLRPFVLTLCIMSFNTLVLGTINGIFSPFVQGTGMMLKDQTYNVREIQKLKDQRKFEAEFHDITHIGGFIEDEELEAMMESFGWDDEDYTVMQHMYSA